MLHIELYNVAGHIYVMIQNRVGLSNSSEKGEAKAKSEITNKYKYDI